jgi:four helix bundle protein
MAQTTNSEAMKNRTKHFALLVIRLCRTVPPSQEGRIITRQLLRAATSVAANYRAVCRARSAADFVSKLGIVLEEADGTLFWLELVVDAGLVSSEKIREALNEANELVSIFVASLRTAKGLNLQSKI